MKIVIAMDSFKESISSIEAINAVEKGILKANENFKRNIIIEKIPIADGGEGTVESILSTIGGKLIPTKVLNPLGKEIESFFGILPDDTAIIEMAAASGLNLLYKEERNPLYTTTYGTGQLIKAALNHGSQKIILGIGGSATNDGGVGMAQALGVRFLDKENKELKYGGYHLSNLKKIDISNIHPKVKDTEIIIASDVTNTLCGAQGATRIYGPQKGADKEMMDLLDHNLKHFTKIIKKDLNKDILNIPGSGAAGGLGAGLIAFLDAKLHKGIDLITDLVDFKKKIFDADIILTGEGSIDGQSIYGKVPSGIGKIASKYKKTVICIGGRLEEGYESLYDVGITSIFSIVDKPMNLQEAIEKGALLLERESENIFRLLFAMEDLRHKNSHKPVH